MRMIDEWWYRVRCLFARGRLETELDEELRFHVEMETEKLVRAGADPREARRRALVAFGGVEQAKEGAREARGVRPFEDLGRDLRLAARTMRRSPGFAAVVVATLAVGIAAATAIFSVADAVLLRPLPYPASDRLYMAWRVVDRYGFDRAPVSYPDFLDWREATRSFDDFAAYSFAYRTLLGAGDPVRLRGARVTGTLFRTLRVDAALGRMLGPGDDPPEAEPVVVLSHGVWQRRFAGDPDVLGRAIELGGERPRVVGVAPAGFDFPDRRVEYWAPLRQDAAGAQRDLNFLRILARLSPGVSPAAAEAELKAVAERVAAAHPGENEIDDVWIESRHAYVVGDVRPVIAALSGAVGLLLALACANLANLLLVRASGRRRELAVRAALGAGGGRLRRPLLIESVLLALLGGTAGAALAAGGLNLLGLLEGGALPRADEIGIDARVLAFAVTLSVACALVCGWLPARAAAMRAPADAIREGGRSTAGDRRSSRVQAGLVVAQVALAMVLLVGAGLIGRSFVRLLSVPTGLDASRVLTAHVSLSRDRYAEPERIGAFFDEALERLEALPGAESVGATWALPFSQAWASDGFRPEGAAGDAGRTVMLAPVRGDYFRTLGTTLLRGRGFTEADGADSPPVAIVNETLAALFWPGGSAIGKRLVEDGEAPGEPITIVGVVADAKRRGLDEPVVPEVYVPHSQATWAGGDMYLTVRAAGDPIALAPSLRREIWALDESLPITGVSTLADRISGSVAAERFRTVTLAALAATAGLLALVGIYGVLSFVVGERTREMAVRLALGATAGGVISQVLGRGLRLTAMGLALGTAGAVAGTRALRGFLFEVEPLDPVTFAAVPMLLLAAAVLAAWAPARRAADADPMEALRQE